MAQVKVTSQVLSGVSDIVSQSYASRRNAIIEQRQQLFTFDELADSLVGEIDWDTYTKAAEYGWLNTFEDITPSKINGVGMQRTIEAVVDLNNTKYVVRDGGVVLPLLSTYSEPVNSEALQPKVDKWVELTEKLDAYDKERNEQINTIQLVLLSYSTVNAALKDNPNLEHILPKWVKDKLTEKVVRDKPEKKDKVTIDPSMLAKIAVMNRLQP